MEKLKAMWEILMGRGVIYNVRAKHEGGFTKFQAAHGPDMLFVAGRSELG